jgi:hypothetical protein
MAARTYQAASSCMILALIGGAGCGWSGQSPSGLRSLLRVDGAQAVNGSISDAADDIPALVSPSTRWNLVFPGASNKQLKGVVGPNANVAAIGVPGDNAYWLVPALTPESADSESYDFVTTFSVSPDLAESPLVQLNPNDGTRAVTLSLRAVDNQGRFGKATTLPLTVDTSEPTGTLVVSLLWDSPVDLDLHIWVPADNDTGYSEVWSKMPAADPATRDGLLDFDSNTACTIDNRDRENVIWQGAPPSGTYAVRVEAFSLCGLTSAQWHALAYEADGSVVGEASGTLTEASTRGTHGAGAGITAFTFDY